MMNCKINVITFDTVGVVVREAGPIKEEADVQDWKMIHKIGLAP